MAQETNKISNKKILVTGGAGYIGSHLCETLIRSNNSVVSLDNYLSGSAKNHIEGVEYITGSAFEINKIFGAEKFDYIFHFGEYSRVEQSLFQPVTALENTTGTITQILKFWKKSGAKLIYSGSSTKFSDDGKGETLSPYTLAKSLNTQLINNFSLWFNLETTIVYFYNVYGGREIQNGIYSTVIGRYKQIIEEGDVHLPVFGTGKQQRNFTHIDDTIDGILIGASMGSGDGYGIGADAAYSILDIVNEFSGQPVFEDSTSANRLSGTLKTEKIKSLGWNQKHDLIDHISDFMRKLPRPSSQT